MFTKLTFVNYKKQTIKANRKCCLHLILLVTNSNKKIYDIYFVYQVIWSKGFQITWLTWFAMLSIKFLISEICSHSFSARSQRLTLEATSYCANCLITIDQRFAIELMSEFLDLLKILFFHQFFLPIGLCVLGSASSTISYLTGNG